ANVGAASRNGVVSHLSNPLLSNPSDHAFSGTQQLGVQSDTAAQSVAQPAAKVALESIAISPSAQGMISNRADGINMPLSAVIQPEQEAKHAHKNVDAQSIHHGHSATAEGKSVLSSVVDASAPLLKSEMIKDVKKGAVMAAKVDASLSEKIASTPQNQATMVEVINRSILNRGEVAASASSVLKKGASSFEGDHLERNSRSDFAKQDGSKANIHVDLKQVKGEIMSPMMKFPVKMVTSTSELFMMNGQPMVVGEQAQELDRTARSLAQSAKGIIDSGQLLQMGAQSSSAAQQQVMQEQAAAPRHVWEQNSVRIAKEMMGAVKANQQKIELTLHPAHLGKVSITIQTDKDKKVSVNMRVENPNSMVELSKHVEKLQETMKQQGMNLGEFSMQSGDGGTGRRQQELLMAAGGNRAAVAESAEGVAVENTMGIDTERHVVNSHELLSVRI
ncbi:MAG: flagellar hook-length control protein FliK, partial [Zetaproteobacteria bacterium]|nr:flagellar hook-length control protein FliK [Zetaproteobacteria bacterium]